VSVPVPYERDASVGQGLMQASESPSETCLSLANSHAACFHPPTSPYLRSYHPGWLSNKEKTTWV